MKLTTSFFGIELPMFILLNLVALTWGIWLAKSHNIKMKNLVFFSAAIVLMITALTQPLAILAESYFSMHMLQHLIMLMLVPPLLWLSIPDKGIESPKLLRKIKGPISNWMLGVGLMWILHFPVFYNYLFSPNGGLCSDQSGMPTFLRDWVHPLHLMITLFVGLLFVFPVLSPWKSLRVKPLQGIGFLVSACTACTVLGAVITFSPIGVFDGYNLLPDPTGMRNLLQNKWGLTAGLDQQIAGLIMWVPGCFIYLSGSLYLFNKWFSEKRKFPSVSIHPELVKPSV